ncbi:hypothetical protein ACQJBY_043497 [Aegilops geniculata]
MVLGVSPRGVHDEGGKIEGCRGAGLRESSVAAHDSCGDPGGEGSRDSAPAESGESAVRADPKALEYIRRVRVGANPTERAPCPGRMGDLEKSIWGFAERDGDKVVKPELGTTFESLQFPPYLRSNHLREKGASGLLQFHNCTVPP